MVIAIFCQQSISPVFLGLQLSHLDHPKQISVSELWFIFQGSPLFMALLGLCLFIDISTLNFGLFSAKLGGTVRTIKKITQNDNGLGPSQNYGETGDFTFNGKVFFWPKMHLNPKNTQNFLMFILEKGTFFFEQLFPVVARTWLILRSELFFGDPKSWFLAEKKLIFCYTTPILVNGPFLALDETVHNPRWERFFDFSFPSYGRFRKKKPGRRVKKCPPSPL